jgi:nitrite reductase (NADH) small subunit
MNTEENKWVRVCDKSVLPDTGLCALVGREQVAIFRDRISDNIYAISNFDPIGEANVLSRGLIGSIDEELVVSSPLYKQHFDLKTGECLEQPGLRLKTYAVSILKGQIHIRYEQ